jgi:hypothetical protein
MVFSTIQKTFEEYRVDNARFVGQFFGRYLVSSYPKIVFNLLNAGMYVCLLLLIVCLSSVRKMNSFSWLKFFLANAFMWLFIDDFGQVVFWRMGATNYLWTTTFLLLAFLPIYLLFFGKKKIISNGWCRPFFLEVLSGWGNEVSSAAVVFTISILVLE